MTNLLSGNNGRNIIITSPDGSFRTKYLHLKEIDIRNGQKVTERDKIGEIGGSRMGKEFGGQVHLHYQIDKLDTQSKQWVPYNPTEGKANKKENVVDPQTWIKSDEVSNDKPKQFYIFPIENKTNINFNLYTPSFKRP